MLSQTLGYLCVRLYKHFSRGRLNRLITDKIARLPAPHKQGRILNIGSGGSIYALVKSHLPAADLIQIDLDPKRNPDVVGDACDMHMFSDAAFDLVLAFEVLEHIPTPQAAVNEIHRVLKPTGEFIGSVPFIFPIHDEPHDYFRFTTYGLAHLFRSFRSVAITPRNDYLHSVLLLMARPLVIGNKWVRLASVCIFLTAVLVYPLWWLLSLVFNNTLSTTGYFITAVPGPDTQSTNKENQ